MGFEINKVLSAVFEQLPENNLSKQERLIMKTVVDRLSTLDGDPTLLESAVGHHWHPGYLGLIEMIQKK